MPKIRNFSTKAARARDRLRRFRLKKKLDQKYQKEVEAQLQQQRNQSRNVNSEMQLSSDGKVNLNLNSNPSYSNEQNGSFEIKEKLQFWAIKHRITKTALNDLLPILISAGHTSLPKDSRTLLQTPKFVDIYPLGDGKMWYHGVGLQLKRVLSKCNCSLLIHLDFNFDGLPIFNSSKTQFWPMLCHIRGLF